jgi:hypothetical protein
MNAAQQEKRRPWLFSGSIDDITGAIAAFARRAAQWKITDTLEPVARITLRGGSMAPI